MAYLRYTIAKATHKMVEIKNHFQFFRQMFNNDFRFNSGVLDILKIFGEFKNVSYQFLVSKITVDVTKTEMIETTMDAL